MTPHNHFLAIDAGGSSVKSAVVSRATGQVVALARLDYRTTHPGPGMVEFDPRVWWDTIQQSAARAVALAEDADVDAVICTGMRIPFVLIDAAGDEVRPGILNHDRRGLEMLDVVRSAGQDELYARTGHWPAPEFGVAKVAWLVVHEPESIASATHILQFHDWLVFRLSGAVISEPSSAAMSGLIDLRTGSWAIDIIEAIGADAGKFPELTRSGTPVGTLRDSVADAIGLRRGVTVYAGGGDTHMSCLGVDGANPGDVTVVAGSTTPVMLTAEEPLRDDNYAPVVSPHIRPNHWAIETNAGATGIRLTWLRNCLRDMGLDQLSYEDIIRRGEASPMGANGLFAVAGDPGWGEAAWLATPPGAIVGLTSTHSVADISRAILEGSTVATTAQIDRVEAVLGNPVQRVRVTGGATRSSFWCQLLADMSGRKIEVARIDEPFTRAAAMLLSDDVASIDEVPVSIFEPVADQHEQLRGVRERYIEQFEALREVA